MRKIDRICVGTDFSPRSTMALESALCLAQSFGAGIDLVSVVEPVSLYTRVITPIQARLVPTEERVALARERMEGAARAIAGGIDVRTFVHVGKTFVELIGHCRKNQNGLLVVGARTESRLERLFLGSTTERVLRKSPVPVLVVKHPLAAAPSRIVAATDFSAASRGPVRQAVDLARHWSARLILVHALEPITEAYTWPVEPGSVPLYLAEPAEIEPEWEEFLRDFDLNGLQWERRTVKGYAPSAIVDLAAETRAELIVLGTHGRTGLAHVMLGSVAEAIAHEAACSVLCVRSTDEAFVLP